MISLFKDVLNSPPNCGAVLRICGSRMCCTKMKRMSIKSKSTPTKAETSAEKNNLKVKIVILVHKAFSNKVQLQTHDFFHATNVLTSSFYHPHRYLAICSGDRSLPHICCKHCSV